MIDRRETGRGEGRPNPRKGTGRTPQRLDLGQRRRWGWGRPAEGLTPFGNYLERCRQLHGHHQAAVAQAAGMRTVEYRSLIKRDIPPPTFDQVVRLAAGAGADPIRAAMYAWTMTKEEAVGLGLTPLRADSFTGRLSQPTLRPKTSNAQVFANSRRY